MYNNCKYKTGGDRRAISKRRDKKDKYVDDTALNIFSLKCLKFSSNRFCCVNKNKEIIKIRINKKGQKRRIRG